MHPLAPPCTPLHPLAPPCTPLRPLAGGRAAPLVHGQRAVRCGRSQRAVCSRGSLCARARHGGGGPRGSREGGAAQGGHAAPLLPLARRALRPSSPLVTPRPTLPHPTASPHCLAPHCLTPLPHPSASPHTASPHCLRPSATRGAARGWQGWERVWRGVHTACLPTLPTFCAPLVPQHPPFPRQFLGRLLSQCALLAADVCGCHGVATCVVACSEQHGPGRVRPRVRACAAVHGLSFSSRSPSP